MMEKYLLTSVLARCWCWVFSNWGYCYFAL